MPLSRTNPNITEEDEFHIVERFLKQDYIKVDDRHIRNPIIGPSVEYYKEDETYYYVYTLKYNAEIAEAQRLLQKTPTPAPPPAPGTVPTPEGPPPRLRGHLPAPAPGASGSRRSRTPGCRI
jgi:hypothetical protein